MKDKIPLLLFSGGADSTNRLCALLQTTNVDTLYIDAHQHPLKKEKERQQRKKIVRCLNTHSPFRVLQDYDLGETFQMPIPKHRFSQMLPWVAGALAVFDSGRHSHIEVGYVQGDSCGPWLQNLREGVRQLGRALYADWDSDLRLEFPLLHASKVDVYRSLPPKVAKLIWVCEYPVLKVHGTRRSITACGNCQPCVSRRQTLERISAQLDITQT